MSHKHAGNARHHGLSKRIQDFRQFFALAQFDHRQRGLRIGFRGPVAGIVFHDRKHAGLHRAVRERQAKRLDHVAVLAETARLDHVGRGGQGHVEHGREKHGDAPVFARVSKTEAHLVRRVRIAFSAQFRSARRGFQVQPVEDPALLIDGDQGQIVNLLAQPHRVLDARDELDGLIPVGDVVVEQHHAARLEFREEGFGLVAEGIAADRDEQMAGGPHVFRNRGRSRGRRFFRGRFGRRRLFRRLRDGEVGRRSLLAQDRRKLRNQLLNRRHGRVRRLFRVRRFPGRFRHGDGRVRVFDGARAAPKHPSERHAHQEHQQHRDHLMGGAVLAQSGFRFHGFLQHIPHVVDLAAGARHSPTARPLQSP